MKFIVDNYSYNASSQALYLHRYLNEKTDNKCYLNNNEIAMFDLLDNIQPDVYISQVGLLSRDLVYYIKQNSYNLNLLINVDNSKIGKILEVEEVLNENKIDFRFFGNMSGVNKVKTKKTPIFNLLDGFDINLEQEKSIWPKKIDYLVVTKYDVDISNIDTDKLLNRTFHVCSFDNASEINTTVLHAQHNLYHNYSSVIFANLEYGINQSFFDCIHNGCKALFCSKAYDQEINKTLCKLLKIESNFNFNHDDCIQEYDAVFDAVEKNHSSDRRVKSLLSQISESKR